MAMKQAMIMAGLLVILTQGANAAGMSAPASLLPPGYVPTAEPSYAPPVPIATDDAERNGMGEADLAPMELSESAVMQPQAMPVEGMGQTDYVDVPPLASMQPIPEAMAPLPLPRGVDTYTQGITTGPKAYNEGNFTFKTH